MMNIQTLRKNKIILSDYNYRRDIETRLLLANININHLEVLKEILDGSLKTSLAHLSEHLDFPKSELITLLDDIAVTKLFVRDQDTISVDKEIRKYLETQIMKFDPNYELGMDYLLTLVSRVPANAIHNWYALPRTSDHLFLSIIEKHFQTPLVYLRYLQELSIDFPGAMNIYKDLMNSPKLKLKVRDVLAKYNMSHEDFQECMLHLEFNLVGCLGYERINESWEEVIVPFYEWQEHQEFLAHTTPKSIMPINEIEREYEDDFGFIKEINRYLISKELPSENFLEIMTLLNLVERNSVIHTITPLSAEWLQLPLQEQAATLYRRLLLNSSHGHFDDHDLRQVQKGLKGIAKLGWVYFDDFLKYFIQPLGQIESITLKNRGKRWRYNRPLYNAVEVEFINHCIFKILSKIGIVATGTHQEKQCFCVTPFGRFSLDD